MKVIIFGSNGMLGSTAKKYFQSKKYKFIFFERKDYQITSKKNIKKILDKINLEENDYILNFTMCYSNNVSEMINVNSIFPKQLSIYCRDKKLNLIHISTNNLFDNTTDLYTEKDCVNPTNIYEKTKYIGEVDYGINFRTTIIGEKRNGRGLLEYIKNNDLVIGYENVLWNGITTLQLIKIIEYFIDNKIKRNGVIHLCSSEVISKYELLDIIKDVYGLNVQLVKSNYKYMKSNLLDSVFEYKKLIKKSIKEQIEELKLFCNGEI